MRNMRTWCRCAFSLENKQQLRRKYAPQCRWYKKVQGKMKRSCWRSCWLFQKEKTHFLLITNNYANNYVSFFLGISCTSGTGARSCGVVVVYFPKKTHTCKIDVQARNNYVPFSLGNPCARAFACALALLSLPARPPSHPPTLEQPKKNLYLQL